MLMLRRLLLFVAPLLIFVVIVDTSSVPSRILRAKFPPRSDHSSSSSTATSASSHHRQQQQLWMYRGTLYDPIDGRSIATVQGLELVRPVYNTSGLAIDKVLRKSPTPTSTNQQQTFHDKNTDNNDTTTATASIDAVTLWSQKVFCYTTTTTTTKNRGQSIGKTRIMTRKEAAPKSLSSSSGAIGNNDNDDDDDDEKEEDEKEILLTNVRIRPQSPRKILPLDQVVSAFETATTYIQTKPQVLSAGDGREKRRHLSTREPVSLSPPPSSSSSPGTVIVHSEWPNGQTVWNTASVPQLNSHDNESSQQSQQQQQQQLQQLDFTVYAKLRSRSSPNSVNPPNDMLFPPLSSTTSRDDNKNKKKGDDVIVGPKRSKLIHFGSSTMDENNKFGARETYSFRNIPFDSAIPSIDIHGSKSHKGRIKGSRRNLAVVARDFLLRPFQKGGDIATTSSATGMPVMSYTRYGEGPPWFAPGRHCLLEIQGRPINSLDEATPVLQSLVCQDGPVLGFGYVENHAFPSSIQDAWGLSSSSLSSSVRLSKRKTSSSSSSIGMLKLKTPSDMMQQYSIDPSRNKVAQRMSLFFNVVKDSSISVWDRLRDASILQAM